MVMKYKLITILSFSALLTGCSFFSPEYKKPNIEAPSSWSSQGAGTHTEQTNLPDLTWWKKFNDPQLDKLIENALKNNNNIQVAMGNIIQAQASLQKVNYSWLPTVDIGGSAFTGKAFNTNFDNTSGNVLIDKLDPGNSPEISGYNVGIASSYNLNIMRQLKMGNIADLNLALSDQAKNAARLAIISQVSGNYFSFLGLQKQLMLQQQLLTDAKSTRKYMKIQYANGSVSSIRLAGINQFIAILQSQIPSLKNKLTQVQNALRILTNRNPGKIITKNNFDNIQTSGIIPVNLPSEVLKSRPDVAIAEYQLQMSNEDIGATASKFFPSISLTGLLGHATVQLANLFTLGAAFGGVSLGAAVPIFNMGIFADIKKSKGAYYSAHYHYVETVRNAFMEVDNGLSQNSTVNQTYEQHKIAFESAKEQYLLATIMYQQGSISYMETLIAKMNTDYARSELNKYKMQQMDSIVNLYDVLGGGYNVNNYIEFKKFNDEHDA
jgi:outer membrane protein, multidrug efflux system